MNDELKAKPNQTMTAALPSEYRNVLLGRVVKVVLYTLVLEPAA